MLRTIKLSLVIFILNLVGCSSIHTTGASFDQRRIDQKLLIGKWGCTLIQQKMDHGEAHIQLTREFSNNQATEKFEFFASIYTPPDSGLLVAETIDEYSLQQNKITMKSLSGNVRQIIEPKEQQLIKLFKPYLNGMTMGINWRVEAKTETSLFIDSIDEKNLRTYKLDLDKRVEEISCTRMN